MESFSLWEQQGLPTIKWNIFVFVFWEVIVKYQKSKPSCFLCIFGRPVWGDMQVICS